MSQYKIHPLVVGTKVFDKTFMTYQFGYGNQITVPIYCWYIEGGDKKILVDSGEMAPIISEAREEAIGGKIYTFEEALAKWGVTPEEIDIIIHTHLHNDHCENDDKCVNAKIYIHKKELERIKDPHPMDYRYLEDFIYEIEERGQIVEIEGDIEIAPGLKMVHTPAHTEGGMSVVVDTAEGKAVIAGCCTILENYFPPKEIVGMGLEVIPPGIYQDFYKSYDILLQIKEMGDIILTPHEPKYANVDTIG